MEVSQADQRKVNVIIGRDYPAPIIEHGFARNRALQHYRQRGGKLTARILEREVNQYMTMAVVVFMVGLVSEQVAQMRFDRSESLRGPLSGKEGP